MPEFPVQNESVFNLMPGEVIPLEVTSEEWVCIMEAVNELKGKIAEPIRDKLKKQLIAYKCRLQEETRAAQKKVQDQPLAAAVPDKAA